MRQKQYIAEKCEPRVYQIYILYIVDHRIRMGALLPTTHCMNMNGKLHKTLQVVASTVLQPVYIHHIVFLPPDRHKHTMIPITLYTQIYFSCKNVTMFFQKISTFLMKRQI